ncbi:MAG: acetylglutamate kinase [Epulopiscium sp.]|nr:acetylglutamate kinase [Candidatus Epulonipiscium sp.]
MNEEGFFLEQLINKAKTLVEALPYIKEFAKSMIIIKYGGSAMLDEKIQNSIIQDIALMKVVGFRPVVVHGGGPKINETLNKMNKVSQFVKGLRVTDQETMEVVEMVLSGQINKDIVQRLENAGVHAVGLSGKDGNTLQANKLYIDGEDIGFVGEVKKIETALLKTLIEDDFIPVIAPIGTDTKGNTYNINADYAALAIASALQARKLIFLTDVEGVLADVSDGNSLISKLYTDEVEDYIQQGVISGGMIPKVQSCVEAIENGVEQVHILDGRVEHSLLLEIFTQKGIGTLIEKRRGFNAKMD